MWVIGGVTKDDAVADVWYSSNGVNWTQATSQAEFGPRQGLGAFVSDNRMWVVGGMSTSPLSLGYRNDVWSSSDGKIWTRETKHAEFSPRMWQRFVQFREKVWLIGGMKIPQGTMVDPNKDYLCDVWYSA